MRRQTGLETAQGLTLPKAAAVNMLALSYPQGPTWTGLCVQGIAEQKREGLLQTCPPSSSRTSYAKLAFPLLVTLKQLSQAATFTPLQLPLSTDHTGHCEGQRVEHRRQQLALLKLKGLFTIPGPTPDPGWEHNITSFL